MPIPGNARLEDVIDRALESLESRTRKVVPATVVSFNASGPSCTVQVSRRITDLQRRPESVPPIPDVPILFPSFGGFVLSGPLEPGDEVLLLIADRELDPFLNTGGKQYTPNGPDARNALTSALALPMRISRPRRSGTASASHFQLAKIDGTASIKFAATGSEVEIDAASIKLGKAAALPVNRQGDTVSPSSLLAAWGLVLETAINALAPGTFTQANSFSGSVAANFASTGPGSSKVSAE